MNEEQNYYSAAIKSFCRAFFFLAKGVYKTLKTLFTRFPNITWGVLMAAVVIVATIKIGHVRTERDMANKQSVELSQQLDSLKKSEIRYSSYN